MSCQERNLFLAFSYISGKNVIFLKDLVRSNKVYFVYDKSINTVIFPCHRKTHKSTNDCFGKLSFKYCYSFETLITLKIYQCKDLLNISNI